MISDLRVGLRLLWRDKAFTLTAALTLALCIGANTALFSIFNSLNLKALPVSEADRLVLLADDSWTNPIWEQIRAQDDQIAGGAFAWSNERFNLSPAGEADPVDGIYASGRIFDVLGVAAIRGRTFTQADDDRRGGPNGPVAVISYGFWQRRFAGADDAIGRTVSINRTPFTIVGVTPQAFFGPEVGRSADVMLPLGTEAIVRGADSSLDGRSSWWLNIMLRLRRDQTLAQATDRLRGVQDQIRVATMPQRGKDIQATYLRDPFTLAPASSGRSALRIRYEQPLRALMGVVGLVLITGVTSGASGVL